MKDALLSFGMELDASMAINDKWVDGVDKDVLSSLTNLLDVVRHIIEDEQTPEIIKMMECDLNWTICMLHITAARSA